MSASATTTACYDGSVRVEVGVQGESLLIEPWLSGLTKETEGLILGLFSLFKKNDPNKIADELLTASMSLSVTAEELAWLPKLYVDEAWWVRERNLLRMGMTKGGVALALNHHRRVNTPRTMLAQALEGKYLEYFMKVMNVTPDVARAFYSCTSNRYIVRTPEEMVLIFHHYLQNPGHWQDRDQETSLRSSIPDGFQDFLHSIMKNSMVTAIVRAKELDA